MRNRTFIMILAGAIFAAATVCPAAAPAAADLNKALDDLAKADWGNMPASLPTIDAAMVAAHGDPATRKILQKRMTAMLSSDVKTGIKQFVLRKLSLIGDAGAVPAIAPLLTDKDLSHMARYALQRIGGPAAVKAIRGAVAGVKGRQKTGMINSLGEMGDAGAVASLTGLLKDSDPLVAGAAASALGRIGGLDAAKTLGAFRTSAPKGLAVVAANAYLDVAAGLLADGKAKEAAAIYTQLENDKLKVVRLAAARGLVAANPTEAMPRLMKALDSKDAGIRGSAAAMIAEAPGTEATKAFAAGLGKLTPDGQIALMRALATKGDPAARPDVAKLLTCPNPEVALVAVKTLGVVGCAADVTPLAAIAAGTDAKAAGAARVSLAKMRGKAIDEAVATAAGAVEPKLQAVLLATLAARQATQTVPVAMKCTASDDANVRIAAFGALGAMAGPECTAAIAKKMVASKDARQREAASKALCAICTRGRDESAPAVMAAMGAADATAKKALLRALLHAGGDKALACVKGVANGSDENLAKEAVRTLSQWRDPTAAPALLDLGKSSKNPVIKILAVRGVMSMAGAMKDQTRAVGLLQDVQKLITRPEETTLLLGTLGNMRYIKALPVVMSYFDKTSVSNEAATAAVKLGREIDQRNKNVRKEVVEAMKKVIATCKDKRTVKQAEDIVKKAPRGRR